MGRRSGFDKISSAIKEAIKALIMGGNTIDDIKDWLDEEMGDDAPSRSATGRFVKGQRQAMEEWIQAQQIAAIWAEKANENPSGDIGQMNLQLLTMLANRTLGTITEQDEVDPEHLALMSNVLRNVATASKTHTERHIKVENELKRKQLEQLQRIEAETPEQADPATLLKRIREEVYGIS